MKTRWLLLIAMALVFPVRAGTRIVNPNKYDGHIRRFMEDVVFTVARGDRGKNFNKLPAAVRVCCHATAAQADLVAQKCRQFAAASGVAMHMGFDGKPDAAVIQVYFGTTETLMPVARRYNKLITLRSGSAYWVWWNGRHVTNKAVIFICTDRIHGAQLEDQLVEDLLGVFGMPARSREAENSCLCAVNKCNPNLLQLDKKALAFLYRHVPAGTNPGGLRKLVREKWEK